MFRKILSSLLVFFSVLNNTIAYNSTEPSKELENIFTFGVKTCENIQETDYPTIFIPGIGASWYSEEGFENSKIKRWIPDPISHVYDTLFYTFKKNGYSLADVFYDNEYTVHIEGNPKHSLYLFGYDWKKDNRISATILTQLVGKILQKYEEENNCNIGKVNIVAHSMGGLVARAMLEDMCLEFTDKGNGIFELLNFSAEKKGKIQKFNQILTECKNPISDFPIMVNKFITISTPHRGAPKSFNAWEKGDLTVTDGALFDQTIKKQLLRHFEIGNGLFKAIHGYDKSIPNGIVGLGQLLPDVDKKNDYNSSLHYIFFKGGLNVSLSSFHPKNSFLEELNTEKKIVSIFDKVKSYTSYYSKITGNISTEWYNENFKENFFGRNNTIGFVGTSKNMGMNGRDIYEMYDEMPDENYFTISSIIRDESGLGGDGTVPTKNLLLVPNDSLDGKEIQNKKFQSKEIQCYSPKETGGRDDWTVGDPIISLLPIIDTIRKYNTESGISKGFGVSQPLEMCSHTKTPISASVRIFEEITGKNISDGDERSTLIKNLGIATYEKIYGYEEKFNIFTLSNSYIPKTSGISNYTPLSLYFEDENYKKVDTQSFPISLDFSELRKIYRYDILSPINVLITDEKGRKIGIDPQTGRIINEIPGAWTSGDTEGSNEPEFFLIPQTGTGKLQHTIQTFGTGNGTFHIELREIDEKGKVEKLMTIPGETGEGFSKNYTVQETTVAGKKSVSFKQTTSKTPTLELLETNQTTYDEIFFLRYVVSGSSKGVKKLKVQLQKPDGKKQEIFAPVNGKLELELKSFGNYTVTLSLVDSNWKQLGQKRKIQIERKDKNAPLGKDDFIYIDIPSSIPLQIAVPKKLR